MGKQVLFHMIDDDCAAFLEFVLKRPGLSFVLRNSHSPTPVEVVNPCEPEQDLYIWDSSLVPDLSPRRVVDADGRTRYYIDDRLPLIEFGRPAPADWDGRPALTQGRIHVLEPNQSPPLSKWFDALAAWIRRSFRRNPSARVGGYVGPGAWQWHEQTGALLLPFVRPPVTEDWRSEFASMRDARS